jgi:hypothetical protein
MTSRPAPSVFLVLKCMRSARLPVNLRPARHEEHEQSTKSTSLSSQEQGSAGRPRHRKVDASRGLFDIGTASNIGTALTGMAVVEVGFGA